MRDDNVTKLLRQYEEKFGDIFPLMSFMSVPEEKIIEKLKKCLESGISAGELYDLKSDGSIKY